MCVNVFCLCFTILGSYMLYLVDSSFECNKNFIQTLLSNVFFSSIVLRNQIMTNEMVCFLQLVFQNFFSLIDHFFTLFAYFVISAYFAYDIETLSRLLKNISDKSFLFNNVFKKVGNSANNNSS